MTIFYDDNSADSILVGGNEVVGFYENITIVKNEMGDLSYIDAAPGIFEIGISVEPSDIEPLSKLTEQQIEEITLLYGEA